MRLERRKNNHMANRTRNCLKCSYRTNSPAAMDRHNQATGHHNLAEVRYTYRLAWIKDKVK